jgi:hypothetical protein
VRTAVRHLWAACAGGALAACAGSALAACAWGPGEPFATLSARIEARLEVPGGRDLGDGWQMLASNYQIAIDTLELETGGVALNDAGAGGGVFDPANPPPGYSLCHNGHCHAEDGSLVSYEDIAAGLGGGGGLVTVVTLPVGTIDVSEGVARDLECAPSCDLPLASIVLAELDVTRVRAGGRVRDGREPARIDEQAWSLDLAFPADAPLVLSTPLSLPADRVHEPGVELALSLAITSRIFDDVAWAAISDPGLALEGDPEARAAIIAALGEVTLASAISR